MFKKYPKINNTYRSKELNWWLEWFPELANKKYISQEKLHGSNLQIAVGPEGGWIVGSRNQKLHEYANFQKVKVYGFIESEYKELLNHLKFLSKVRNAVIRVYGELCGPHIQKGVDYGEDTFFKIFDMMIDDELFSIEDTYLSLEMAGLSDCLVPIVSTHDNIWDAFNQGTNVLSKINPVEGNVIEGVVIKPNEGGYVTTMGQPFYWKKKNEDFSEKQKAPKPKMTDTEIIRLNKEFKSYLTYNRLQNIFSKYGEIESPKQIGEYIKYMMIDAKEDFNKDFKEKIEEYEGKERKQIYKDHGTVAKMLKEYL